MYPSIKDIEKQMERDFGLADKFFKECEVGDAIMELFDALRHFQEADSIVTKQGGFPLYDEPTPMDEMSKLRNEFFEKLERTAREGQMTLRMKCGLKAYPSPPLPPIKEEGSIVKAVRKATESMSFKERKAKGLLPPIMEWEKDSR